MRASEFAISRQFFKVAVAGGILSYQKLQAASCSSEPAGLSASRAAWAAVGESVGKVSTLEQPAVDTSREGEAGPREPLGTTPPPSAVILEHGGIGNLLVGGPRCELVHNDADRAARSRLISFFDSYQTRLGQVN